MMLPVISIMVSGSQWLKPTDHMLMLEHPDVKCICHITDTDIYHVVQKQNFTSHKREKLSYDQVQAFYVS